MVPIGPVSDQSGPVLTHFGPALAHSDPVFRFLSLAASPRPSFSNTPEQSARKFSFFCNLLSGLPPSPRPTAQVPRARLNESHPSQPVPNQRTWLSLSRTEIASGPGSRSRRPKAVQISGPRGRAARRGSRKRLFVQIVVGKSPGALANLPANESASCAIRRNQNRDRVIRRARGHREPVARYSSEQLPLTASVFFLCISPEL